MQPMFSGSTEKSINLSIDAYLARLATESLKRWNDLFLHKEIADIRNLLGPSQLAFQTVRSKSRKFGAGYPIRNNGTSCRSERIAHTEIPSLQNVFLEGMMKFTFIWPWCV